MSFITSPTIFKGPIAMTFDLDDPCALRTPFFVGRDDDDGFFCYLPNEANGDFNKYTISQQISYTLKDGPYAMARQPDTINDKPWFASFSYQLYYTPTYKWVYISTSFFPGYVPQEYLDSDSVYQGDAFYSALSIPDTSDTASKTLSGRGTHLNTYPAPTITLSFWWPRYAKTSDPSNPGGKYTEVAGSGATAGTKYLGLPQWYDNLANTYTRSIEKDANFRYQYGEIHYNITAAKWIIGVYGSDTGWWEGNEPSEASSTFTFTVPEESTVTGDNLTLTYNGYGIGALKTGVYIAEIGIYR